MILKLLPLFIVISVTDAITDRCQKELNTTHVTSKTDELLNAFYIADPDPQTGNVVFGSHPQQRNQHKLTGIITGSSLTFNTWLQKLHPARDDFRNLWVYVTRLIASDMGEMFGHKQSLSNQAATKPRPAINFAALGSTFSMVCASPAQYNTTWPFSCFESKFFCALSTALTQPLFTSMTAVDNVQCRNKNLFAVNSMSKLAVDNNLRATALQKLFHADIVAEFNDADVLKPLYQSGLVRGSLTVLLSNAGQRRTKIYNQLTALRSRLNTGCSTYRTVPLGSAYYCAAHEIVNKTVQCYALSDSSICAYHPMFQQYFEIGKFNLNSELDLVAEMRSRLRVSLTAISTAITTQNAIALRTQVNLHNTYLLVQQDTCTMYWSKAFDCGNSEECKLQTILRFDCLIKTLTNAAGNFLTAKGSWGWTNSNLVKERAYLNIFLFYPPMRDLANLPQTEIGTTISDFHQKVDDLSKRIDEAGFATLLGKLPPSDLLPSWVSRSLCSTGNIREGYNNLCLIGSLINAIHQFVDRIALSKTSSIRVLNPSIGYVRLLEQLQLEKVSAYLNSQSITYFQLLTNQINTIPSYIQENFQSVGNYFQSLARYDTKKLLADVAFIKGNLNSFKSLLSTKTSKVSKKFGLLLGLAIGAITADVIQRGVELALEIALNFNPLKHIFGGSDPGSIVDRVNELAQSTVGLSKLITLGVRILPELGRRAQYLKSGFETNDRFLGIVNTLVNNINSTDPDIEEKADEFLVLYNDYSPAILRSDISAFGTLWETAVDEMCEAAFDGGTAAAAAFEIGIASKGDCISIRPLIAEMITIDEEIYDYQYDLIETLASAVRAKYASNLAKNMSKAYTSQRQVDLVFFKNNAIIALLSSTLHIWGIVNEYCDILEYTSGGTNPTVCVSARALPDKSTLTNLISHDQDKTCITGTRHEIFLEIPTTTSSSANAQDTSNINIDKLFKGETVIFKIPNANWLVSHDIISNSETNNAIFVEQFQVFLPVMLSGQQLVQVNVQPSDANILRNDATRYIIGLSGYQSKYRVNKPSCFGTYTWLPYDYCQSLSQACVTQDAKIERDIQPSIYNAWRIRVTAPVNLNALKPKTALNLMVGLTYCTKNSAGKKRDVANQTPADYSLLKNRKTRQASSRYCCQNNQYLVGVSCQDCPAGSTRRLSGYYCE